MGALVLGITVIGLGILWFRFAEPFSRWMFDVLSVRYPRIAERPLYRRLYVYGGAAFLVLAGLGTLIASAVNLSG
jgi:hypothetical protein